MEISHYTLNRNVSEESAIIARDALSMTPINCVIITQPTDVHLALQFSQQVVQATSDADALDVATYISKAVNQPVLIIGLEPGLHTVYDDGTTQEIKC